MKERFVAMAVVLATLMSCKSPGQEDRPAAYPERWPQIKVFQASKDPRTVVIERLGAGPSRRAEVAVFELVDHGRRLRRRHAATLQNDLTSWTDFWTSDGRFLVTIDDFGQEMGTTANCLVIYDLVRGKHAARRLEDFAPAEVRATFKSHPVFPGLLWNGANSLVDEDLLTFYPSRPSDCRDLGLPFFVVDLRSMTVEIQPTPHALPPAAVEPGGYQSPLGTIHWEWSMGERRGEPPWMAKGARPAMLRGTVDADNPNEALLKFLRSDVEICFKLDSATGEYVRCAAGEFAPRAAESGIRHEAPSDGK